jgi:hypothetical protein
MSGILIMLICVGMILLDNLLPRLLFIAMIDLSRTCDSTTSLICYALVMFMIYPWIKVKLKVVLFPTLQKLRHFSFMAEFVDALKHEPLTGVTFKRWQMRVTLWLTTMNVFCVSEGKPKGGPYPLEGEGLFQSQHNLLWCGG